MENHVAQREPTVFVIPELAHFELLRLRENARLMTRLVEPGSVALHDCKLHPHALSFWFTTVWRALDEYLQATYWSADLSLDIEEAHKRAAAIRERNEAMRGIVDP